jgi:hypothetical protein
MPRLANVFHVSLLEPVVENDEKEFPDRTQPPPPPILSIDDEPEYEVAEILDSRRKRKNVQYLVAWRGYGPEENTWEPALHLQNCPEMVESFHRQFPKKPRAKFFSSPGLQNVDLQGGDVMT